MNFQHDRWIVKSIPFCNLVSVICCSGVVRVFMCVELNANVAYPRFQNAASALSHRKGDDIDKLPPHTGCGQKRLVHTNRHSGPTCT